MFRRLAHPQTTGRLARSLHNLPLHPPGHPQLSNRLYHPAVYGVTRLSAQWNHRNAVWFRHAAWGGQVAGFHSTRRNEGVPLMPFFAAILKVRPSHMEVLVDINVVFTGVQFHRARPNRQQGGSIARSFALFQEP